MTGDWFARRTHHWRDWSLDELLAAKADTGTRVSLVVPARSEAATVGAVVSRLRDALIDTVALLYEIVVIDSDSTDETYAVATDAGAVVHRSAEIRPDLGTFPGKGEAMWKSQFVTSGDVLVFIDADLLDWDTHFVPGLLGPLLSDATVCSIRVPRESVEVGCPLRPSGGGGECGTARNRFCGQPARGYRLWITATARESALALPLRARTRGLRRG